MPVNVPYRTEGEDQEEQGVMFRNSPLSSAFLFEIARCMKGIDEFESVDEWNGQTLRALHGEYFVVELSDAETRTRKESLWRALYQKRCEFGKSFQIPRVCGTFEFEGKPYIILSADVEMSGETNGMLYNGLVLDPEGFMESLKNAVQVQKATQDRTDGLV